jgi:hypothetical protein
MIIALGIVLATEFVVLFFVFHFYEFVGSERIGQHKKCYSAINRTTNRDWISYLQLLS